MSKRSIFEEVEGEKKDAPAVQPGLIDRGRGGARKGIRAWLMVLFALVVAMIVVGGLTRLTDSGLSITEWRPVTGAIPPMSEAEWQAEFDKYKEIDQWRIQNQWMELSDFKSIYWWEWGHRQLGRFIGVVWALGFLGFLAARKIPAGWTGRLLLPGILGGVQGAIGWWMTLGADFSSQMSASPPQNSPMSSTQRAIMRPAGRSSWLAVVHRHAHDEPLTALWHESKSNRGILLLVEYHF